MAKTYEEKCRIVSEYLERKFEEEKAYQKKTHNIRNYSQNRWAAAHHFSSPSMSQWILGQRLPEDEHIYQMAVELGDEILDELEMNSLDASGFMRYMIKDPPNATEAKQLITLYRKLKGESKNHVKISEETA